MKRQDERTSGVACRLNRFKRSPLGLWSSKPPVGFPPQEIREVALDAYRSRRLLTSTYHFQSAASF